MVHATATGVAIDVRVIPRARKTALAGMRDGALLVRLTAPPVDGEANLALRQFLADTLSVPVRAIRMTSGERGRSKRLEIEGLTANFLKLIARNRRLFAAPDMIKAFRALLARHRGQTSAEVTSALPLSEGQLRALQTALKAALHKEVQLDQKVDATLLGGLVVKVGSRMIDSSLRTKLNSLKQTMKEVG